MPKTPLAGAGASPESPKTEAFAQYYYRDLNDLKTRIQFHLNLEAAFIGIRNSHCTGQCCKKRQKTLDHYLSTRAAPQKRLFQLVIELIHSTKNGNTTFCKEGMDKLSQLAKIEKLPHFLSKFIVTLINATGLERELRNRQDGWVIQSFFTIMDTPGEEDFFTDLQVEVIRGLAGELMTDSFLSEDDTRIPLIEFLLSIRHEPLLLKLYKTGLLNKEFKSPNIPHLSVYQQFIIRNFSKSFFEKALQHDPALINMIWGIYHSDQERTALNKNPEYILSEAIRYNRLGVIQVLLAYEKSRKPAQPSIIRQTYHTETGLVLWPVEYALACGKYIAACTLRKDTYGIAWPTPEPSIIAALTGHLETERTKTNLTLQLQERSLDMLKMTAPTPTTADPVIPKLSETQITEMQISLTETRAAPATAQPARQRPARFRALSQSQLGRRWLPVSGNSRVLGAVAPAS